MNIYIFIIFVMILLVLTFALILVFSKCDNIKEVNLKISFENGIEFKSLFYKKQ